MDWPAFCRDHGIAFDERGGSVKRGNINIRCPFCREGESKLMGLEIGTSRWACWKNARHRGRNAAYLIVSLLGCTPETAQELAGTQVASGVDELRQRLAALGQSTPAEAPLGPYVRPPGCFPLQPGGRRSAPFLRYLERRGLPGEAVERYDLHGSDTGEFRGRVILPIHHDGQVVGATGRAVRKHDRRYHTMPGGVGTRCLLLEQLATGGQLLAVVEGPFDAMSLDWAAHTAGMPVHAVALGGLALTRPKRKALDRLCARYDRTVLLLDATALVRALELQSELASEVAIGQLPPGVDDAGELDLEPARDLLAGHLPPCPRRRSRNRDTVLDKAAVPF